MKKRSEGNDDWEALQAKIIGLGESSLRKSHYSQSRDRLRDLDLFRQLLDASEEIILVADLLSAVIVDANGGACKKLGFERSELVGALLSEVCSLENRSLLDELRAGQLSGKVQVFSVHCKDGSVFSAEGSIGIETADRDFVCLIARDVSERLRADTELRLARDALEVLNVTLEERVKERTAELASALEHLRDLNASLEQAQGQLVQAETLAGLGRMVAVIAHELNTPIGNSRISASTIHDEAKTFAQKMQGALRRADLDYFVERVLTGTELLDRALRKAGNLVASFKQVAVDQTTAQRRMFDLAVVMSEIRMTLEPTFKRSLCTLVWEVEESIQMDSYPGPLGQILINLINNALLHGFDGRPPGTVKVMSQMIDHQVEISVVDDGVGIAASDIKRVFDPFFTTKMGRGGTGLGLNIAFNIATTVLGGSIAVSSEPGQGACFTVRLPLVAPVVEEKPPLPIGIQGAPH